MFHARPSYTDHDGFLMPKGFPVEGFASALTYPARAGDIFISTYPKCGTTWAQHIVYLILHRGEPLSSDRRMTDEIPQLEEVGRETVEALPDPRCIKTHLPFQLTPHHREARYIYVARNPFDCAVSFYHHTRGFVQLYDFAEGSFDDFFECFVAGEVDFGDYFDNLIPWYEQRDDENVLFLTYEQMKAAPDEAIIAVGNFLGPGCAAIVQDDEILKRILRHSSFDSMRTDQDRWSSRRPKDMPAFIRTGQVGDWMNHFSAEQARRLGEKFARRARGTDLELLWPEVLRTARRPLGCR